MKLAYYTDIYIDLGNYLSVYLSGGHLTESEIDNPFNFEPDVSEKIFICFTSIRVSTPYA